MNTPADELNFLISQYQIEKELCDSAPTLDALMYWWQKWNRTAYRIYMLISGLGAQACHINPAFVGNPAEDR